MKIAVAISCLIYLVSLGGVDGFTKKRLSMKHRSNKPGMFKAGLLQPKQRRKTKKKCKHLGGSCQENWMSCPGNASRGKKYCNGSKDYFCCIPTSVCGTESKCGSKGGFCIPDNEYCNGDNTITGDGYCNPDGGCKCCLTPTVYKRDIENTIAFALRNRVPYGFYGPTDPEGYRTLQKEEIKALSVFAKSLSKNLKGILRSSVLKFLKCLRKKIRRLENIGGRDLELIYNKCEESKKIDLPVIQAWIGCRNTDQISTERTRSYPCGLWNTYHTITVDLTDKTASSIISLNGSSVIAQTPSSAISKAASSVLPILRDVVEYFPWCPVCKKNFMGKKFRLEVTETCIWACYQYASSFQLKDKYANLDGGAASKKTPYDVTMWLWLAHNNVTEWVKDQENDLNPGRSELQFPGIEQCPEDVCRDNGNFYEPKVYRYLQKVYNPPFN